jgi:hypothetical protein
MVFDINVKKLSENRRWVVSMLGFKNEKVTLIAALQQLALLALGL